MNIIKFFLPFLITMVAALTHPVLAQDQRDQEIFGAPVAGQGAKTATTSPESNSPDSPDSAAISAKRLKDSLEIGGRLEVRGDTGQVESTSLPATGFGQLKQADIYFDTRPNQDLRAFLRARFSEAAGIDSQLAAPSSGTCTDCLRTDVDEMWLKWDIKDTIYATVGKQHLKWGSGRFWNPTDFTATQIRDPLALFDRRLGTDMIKLNLPLEHGGHNYYAVLQYGDASQVQDMGMALRAEYAFLGAGEAAVSMQTKSHGPLHFGLDLSSALGPVDIHSETAISKRETQTFYSGRIDPTANTLPVATQNSDDWFWQSVAGVDYSWKYSANNTITVGAEYFFNQLGYDDRDLELYSLVTGQSVPLYAGRHYVGAYINLPTPGSWTETSFFLDGLRNLSDETSLVRLTGSWLLYKDAEIQGFVGRCFGDYGEFCFRVPQSYAALAQTLPLPQSPLQSAAMLPTKRTIVTGGAGLVVKF